jgi:hypothetical protein
MSAAVRESDQGKKVVSSAKQQLGQASTQQQATGKPDEQPSKERGDVVKVVFQVPVYKSSTGDYGCGIQELGCYALGKIADPAVHVPATPYP